MKVFISSDIEGTNGISHWDETKKDRMDYREFVSRMTQEVKSVCDGINDAYPSSFIFVKDSHETGRNLEHEKLPENVTLNRNWAGNPLLMMDGIDSSFDCSILTGHHSGAASGGNPLSHTMSGNIISMKINSVYASEYLLNYYISLYYGVPVVMVAGDDALCKSAKELDPNIYTVSTMFGVGASVTSPHPSVTKLELREKAKLAVSDSNIEKISLKLPHDFKTEIYFKKHTMAYKASFYPGAKLIRDHSVGFNTTDFYEFMRFYLFVS